MLHHVTLEVRTGDLPEDGRFWVLAGFERVPVPEALGAGYSWFEKGGTQIHLLETDDPVIPATGHVAVVAPDFEETMVRLAEGGFAPEERRPLWGERRAKVTCPSGHVVELMAAPPTRSAKSA
ncbi:MAG TPA: hypothetical protein VMF31_04245 [Solirubrobacterales bacterium]|nr:hypothetical protein [Solirubrobacterales bacterium]